MHIDMYVCIYDHIIFIDKKESYAKLTGMSP